MNEIMKAIVILQAVRDTLRAKQPGLAWGDLSEESEQLQEVIAMLSALHDERERLRNLDYRDVTDEQQQRLWEDYPHLTKKQIARSVRVMLGGET